MNRYVNYRDQPGRPGRAAAVLLAAGLAAHLRRAGCDRILPTVHLYVGRPASLPYETGRRTAVSFLMGVLAATFFTTLAGAVVKTGAATALRARIYQLIDATT